MKLTEDKIYDTVREVVGEDTIPIIKYLKDKKNISDFKIAEEVDKDIHEIRNILYRLYNHNLVSYYRKKDRQKGWYISYWTFNKKRIKELLEKTGIVATPGVGFGGPGEGYVRFTLTVAEPEIREAILRMKKAF